MQLRNLRENFPQITQITQVSFYREFSRRVRRWPSIAKDANGKVPGDHADELLKVYF